MKIKGQEVDPRSKLLIVLCLSSLSIVIKDLVALSIILLATILISILFSADLRGTIKKAKGLIYLLIGMALIQSIFSKGGTNLIVIGNFNILTTSGLKKSLEFILRMLAILFSATILSTSSPRKIIQGFVQLGMAYEIAFMVAIGIRFLPILSEEIKDSIVAIQLRGIELEKIPMKKRIHIYSYIFTPVIISSISKAEKLSVAMEMRGFRAYDNRTSYMTLKMKYLDYVIIFLSILFTTLFLAIYLKTLF